MLQLLLTVAAGLGGYLFSRNFVRNRLRFVDAIHGIWFPLVAGVLGFLLAWPLALLPLVSAAPAALSASGSGSVGHWARMAAGRTTPTASKPMTAR